MDNSRPRPRSSRTARTPWRASSSASSTTSTAPCASRWRSFPSATTRPRPRSRWLAGCGRSSRRWSTWSCARTWRRSCRSSATAGFRWPSRRSRARSRASPKHGHPCRSWPRSPRRRPSTRPSPTHWTPRASSWSWSTAPRTTCSSGRRAARSPPALTTRPSRRRPHCTATPSVWRSVTCAPVSPNWRSTCCTTAVCGTGRSGGTSTSSCRSATATTTPTARSCSSSAACSAAWLPGTRTGCGWTRTANATCGPGCGNTSPRRGPTPRTASTSAARSTRPAGSRSSASTAPTPSRSHRPARAPGSTA